MHLRTGAVRRDVPVNFVHQRRVALFVQIYEELDKKGNLLEGYGNPEAKFLRLPSEHTPNQTPTHDTLNHTHEAVRISGTTH